VNCYVIECILVCDVRRTLVQSRKENVGLLKKGFIIIIEQEEEVQGHFANDRQATLLSYPMSYLFYYACFYYVTMHVSCVSGIIHLSILK